MFLDIEFLVIHVLVLSWLMFLGSGFWVLGSRILLMLCFWFGVLVTMDGSCLGSGFWWFTFWVLGSWFLDMDSWFWVVLSWFWVLGCLFLVLGSGLFVLGSGINAL